jgi:uncharacterized lipoprotein YmbA
MIRRVVLSLGCLILVACAATTPQIQHLQLSAGEARAAKGEQPIIVLDAVDLPDFLLRDELLVRESDYTLHYDHNRRWAEPLDLGIQRVLGRRLGASLGTRRIVLYPDAPSAGIADWRLRVSVLRFEAEGDEVLLRANGRWEAMRGTAAGMNNIETIEFERRLRLGGNSGADIAQTMSQLLWEFAEGLAEPLRTR